MTVRVRSLLLRSDMALLGKLEEPANSTFNIAAEPAVWGSRSSSPPPIPLGTPPGLS